MGRRCRMNAGLFCRAGAGEFSHFVPRTRDPALPGKDVAAAHMNPLDHYNQFGWNEGRDPSVDFDTTAYLAVNPDVAAANINPLLHFLYAGQREGRSPEADGIWG
jgi:hypothetical protein